MIFMKAAIWSVIAVGAASRFTSITVGSTAPGTAVKSCVAKLIIQFLFFRITQHIIGFRCFLELLFRLCISGIGIRVVFLGQFTICSFDRSLVCTPADSKNIIIISFCRHCSPSRHLLFYMCFYDMIPHRLNTCGVPSLFFMSMSFH